MAFGVNDICVIVRQESESLLLRSYNGCAGVQWSGNGNWGNPTSSGDCGDSSGGNLLAFGFPSKIHSISTFLHCHPNRSGCTAPSAHLHSSVLAACESGALLTMSPQQMLLDVPQTRHRHNSTMANTRHILLDRRKSRAPCLGACQR